MPHKDRERQLAAQRAHYQRNRERYMENQRKRRAGEGVGRPTPMPREEKLRRDAERKRATRAADPLAKRDENYRYRTKKGRTRKVVPPSAMERARAILEAAKAK